MRGPASQPALLTADTGRCRRSAHETPHPDARATHHGADGNGRCRSGRVPRAGRRLSGRRAGGLRVEDPWGTTARSDGGWAPDGVGALHPRGAWVPSGPAHVLVGHRAHRLHQLQARLRLRLHTAAQHRRDTRILAGPAGPCEDDQRQTLPAVATLGRLHRQEERAGKVWSVSYEVDWDAEATALRITTVERELGAD